MKIKLTAEMRMRLAYAEELDITDIVAPIIAERDALASQLGGAMQEASSLAMSIWRSEFSKNAPEFELCDSARGVISQIDNMYAGVRNQRDKLQQERNELAATVERISTFIKLSAKKWEGVPEVEPTFWNLLRVANEPLQQHLREVRAEAVCDFIEFMYNSKDCQLCSNSLDVASKYAENLKGGKL